VHASLAFVQGQDRRRDDPYLTRPSTAGQASVPGLRFRILREHARGGLGAVFVAQDEELHRQVALKEIQEKYAHHAESQSRFLLEAEVTGGLEHPGIVPVYGLGRYPDGRPFYAMRFIRGDSLHEAIRRFYAADDGKRDPGERSLAFRELLGQFVTACNALAYAHDRGVLHRDVKPHNIMLGKFGETLLVDWGLAKVLGDRDGHSKSEEGVLLRSASGDSTPTQAGHVMGTPAYMSPEQAEGRLDVLGPASDIYSLGATLYELLTGKQAVGGGHVGEILARVKRGDWLPPRKVRKDVPAPLDAICRKALALRPEDRYATALELAVDIEHWLADEPVTAYREPFTWKLRRWVRRHRGLAAGVAGLLITAVAALAVGIVLVNDQKNQKEQARLLTWQALDDMTSTAIGGWFARQKTGKLEQAQKEFLERGRESYRQFAQESGASEEVRSRVAAAHLRLGDMYSWLGQGRDAEEAYHGAIDHYKELVNDFPKAEDYQRELAKGYNNLGNLLKDTNRSRDAEKVFRESLTNLKKLVEKSPAAKYHQDLAGTYNDLANLLRDMGGLEQAETAYHEAIAINKRLMEQSPEVAEYREELAGNQNNLGILLGRRGRPEEAEQAYREALALYRKLSREFPTATKYIHRTAQSHQNMGALLTRIGHLPEAETALQEAVALFQQLVGEFRAVPVYRQELAATYDHLGTLLKEAGQSKESEAAYRDAEKICKRLVDESPDTPSYRQDLGRSLNNVGILLVETGQPEAAEAAYSDAISLQKRLVADFPEKPDYANQLAITMISMAELLRERKDFVKARELLDAANTHHQAVLKAAPLNADYRRFFRINRVVLASILAGSGNHDAARQTAAQLATLGWDPAEDPYAAARALAQSVRVLEKEKAMPQLVGTYVDQALAMLRQAISNGYKDAARMGKDKDLGSLRSQPEFQKLLKELEEKGAGK